MNNTTKKLTVTAVLFALTAVMAFLPIGMILIPGFAAINLLLIPTAVAAIALNKYYGTATSTFLGILSLILAYTRAVSPVDLLFRYPQVSVLSRIPIGFVIAVVYKFCKRLFKREILAVIAGVTTGAVCNTVIVTIMILLTMWIFPQSASSEVYVAFTFFPLNLALEIAALILTVPAITYALKRAGISAEKFDAKKKESKAKTDKDIKTDDKKQDI